MSLLTVDVLPSPSPCNVSRGERMRSDFWQGLHRYTVQTHKGGGEFNENSTVFSALCFKPTGLGYGAELLDSRCAHLPQVLGLKLENAWLLLAFHAPYT
jgi:hypothetical protein